MSIKEKYYIKKIFPEDTYEWLKYVHYAKRIPSITYAFGLFDKSNNKLHGVCTFGCPPSRTLCTGICGEDYVPIVLELNRLVVLSEDKNILSFFVSQCLKALDTPKIVVSYADTEQNHHGYIYQACNFLYTGLSAKRTDTAVKGREGIHNKTLSNNAKCKRGDLTSIDYLKKVYGDDLYKRQRPRKHRYVYFLGSKKEKKEMLKKLNYKIVNYPKGENIKYNINYNPTVTRNKLF